MDMLNGHAHYSLFMTILELIIRGDRQRQYGQSPGSHSRFHILIASPRRHMYGWKSLKCLKTSSYRTWGAWRCLIKKEGRKWKGFRGCIYTQRLVNAFKIHFRSLQAQTCTVPSSDSLKDPHSINRLTLFNSNIPLRILSPFRRKGSITTAFWAVWTPSKYDSPTKNPWNENLGRNTLKPTVIQDDYCGGVSWSPWKSHDLDNSCPEPETLMYIVSS
jgi:hypothetical protein